MVTLRHPKPIEAISNISIYDLGFAKPLRTIDSPNISNYEE
jgi:hypothetical protein